MECPICFESKILIKTICNHSFCNKCLQKIKICAICRNTLKNQQETKYNFNYFIIYLIDNIIYIIYYIYLYIENNNILETINDIHEIIHIN